MFLVISTTFFSKAASPAGVNLYEIEKLEINSTGIAVPASISDPSARNFPPFLYTCLTSSGIPFLGLGYILIYCLNVVGLSIPNFLAALVTTPKVGRLPIPLCCLSTQLITI